MTASEIEDAPGDNRVERVLGRLGLNLLIPALAWIAFDHAWATFLQGRLLDGLGAIAMYGAVFLGSLQFYAAERRRSDAAVLRRKYLLRAAVVLGSLSASLFFLPAGAAFRLARANADGSMTVFLDAADPHPGETVGAMLRIDLPNPDLCDVIQVQLLGHGSAGRTVFRQEGFSRDSEGNFFGPVFYGGCSCRFGFPVPEDFDRGEARFRVTYKQGRKRTIPFLVSVEEGSVLRTIPLY
jgi:hypothetical protein